MFSAIRVPRLFLAVFCLALLAGQILPCLAAPARQQAEKAPAASAVPRKAEENAEALFAAMLVDAEKGQPRAMLTVGIFYEQGSGVARNFSKAFAWYGKAAEAGDGEAWMRLGVCHEIGIGVAADTGKALEAYGRAASGGFAPARHKLADMYLNGKGVARDEARGFEFLNQAAEGGELAAMYDMGQVLRSGLFGRKAEAKKARQWFGKAAEAGHAASILSLASMLKDGPGGKAEPEEALRWYLIGRKSGMSGAPLDAVITELRGKLSKSKAREAEKAADAWITAKSKAR